MPSCIHVGIFSTDMQIARRCCTCNNSSTMVYEYTRTQYRTYCLVKVKVPQVGVHVHVPVYRTWYLVQVPVPGTWYQV